ncbi:hypothetical protein BDP27DRAFT_1426053 [Rhodocollybia butyracea]|uniref:SAM domain-containing protein n=1 Tax=Rhodocollybia butyracea TaxID=206335 RepID=A0A9P5PFA5_9AGAR|nr:hypothetical protein BDP27DRAFT_1426053 [Rhodocollybia butyracea]
MTPPQPRKKGRKSDKNKKQVPPKDLNLSVSLQLYMYPTPAEAKKPVKDRTAAKTQIWKFDFADPLSTFEAQLLVPAERDINSDDDPVNQNIIALRGQWPCETKSCLSKNCWINPETAAHFPLHFKRLERWSMAMLDGPKRAMIDSPPNDPLFTTNNEDNSLASHVLQQRQVRRNSTANGSNISINITPKVAALLRPAPLPSQFPTPITTATATLSLLLLSPDHMPGPHMTMADFCTRYGLDESVSLKLIQLGYANMNSLQYTQVSDLKECGLLPGNIAQLHAAVLEWSLVHAG